MSDSAAHHHDHDHHAPAKDGALDPVCGMTVDPATAKHRATVKGADYFFCSAGCKTKFAANPLKYIAALEARGRNAVSVPPMAIGILATFAMLGIYFGVLTLVSGWDFTVSEFSRFGYYVVALAFGFGIQIGLYFYLKQQLAHHHSGGTIVVASGATSTGAMLACCTHYLANILPIIGAAGAVTLVAQYQVELFWVGLTFNLAGIGFIGSRILSARRTP